MVFLEMIIGTMISSRVLGYFTIILILFISVIRVSSNNLCEELPTINNGNLVLEENQKPPFNVNDTLTYQCGENYKTDENPPKVTCILKDNVANWTESTCKLILVTCHDPGYIANADRTGLMFTFPNKITYVCHEGYRMMGIATKYCSRTGVWQPQQNPFCEEILCPALGHPANGKVLHSNRRFESVAVYKCDRNHKLVGNSERECQADGTWSGDMPVCEKITCKAPGKFPNGRIIGKIDTVYNASDILIFRCNDGVTHATSKCLEIGEWNFPPPVCPGTTIVETSPTNSTATTVEEASSTNSTIFPSVPIGEKNKGTTVVEVPSSTSTSATTPSENKGTSCEDPGKIKNGVTEIGGLDINSTVTYMCDEGYELRGKSTLLCLENGKWDLDKLPICVEPVSTVTILVIVFAVILLILLGIGGYFWYRYKVKSRGYGEKSKALTADATDVEEIAGLEREKKQIPVTVL